MPCCTGPNWSAILRFARKCGQHMRIAARLRLQGFLDAGAREEIGAAIGPVDMLKFRDGKRYKDRLHQAQKNTGESDALVVMAGSLKGLPVVAAAFEFDFMGGSMGSVVGERFALAVEAAIERDAAFVCFSASGGARMQEALFFPAADGKTASMLGLLRRKNLPYISVLTNPTMGGVSASLATLGDINIAEPNALIGFAGPRVIEQTVRQTLPEGFQRSEFLLQHGDIDMIIDRRALRDREWQSAVAVDPAAHCRVAGLPFCICTADVRQDKIHSRPGQGGGAALPRLDQWLKWQESLHFTAIELGLERCRQVAANMGLLQPAHTVISVAGTNGKGSSVVLLDEILRRRGL